MRREVKIIIKDTEPQIVKGNFFEELVGKILSAQRFNVTKQVRFAGMEIDLIANHKDRISEIAYVECKAKAKLQSSEIHTFLSKCRLEQANYGYFMSTSEFQKDVAGLIERLEKNQDEWYKRIYFFGPEKIIELLVDSRVIDNFKIENSGNVSKQILAYTFFGKFYINLILDGNIAKYFSVFDAEDSKPVSNVEVINKIQQHIIEIKDLSFKNPSGVNQIETNNEQKINLEKVTEIKESEEWYDYAPASVKHFVGRENIRKDITDFLEAVRKKKTNDRIFYIDGNSGYGKSSLIAELRGRSRNKYWKNRFFILAVDSRSAYTGNFVALSFEKLLEKAFTSKFIERNLFHNAHQIISPFDVIASESIKRIIRQLEDKKRLLVLVFDQFEDVFRKEGLFNAFYKFLLDVNEAKTNIIVGFSWKSEINIPIKNPSYPAFHQIKDYALKITIPEFGSGEINSVINQLQESINQELPLELRRKLTEGSQGFPWLIKKLCIHVFQQVTSGKSLEQLLETDLDIKSIFDRDLKDLSPQEKSKLDYIAKKSYFDNTFDMGEVEDRETLDIIESLIHRRLIIRTEGTKCYVYWDIFRDYLVTGEVPVIGESYLLRISPTPCFDVFQLFHQGRDYSTEELLRLTVSGYTQKSLDNVLNVLKTLGIIKRDSESGKFYLNGDIKDSSKGSFLSFISKKFETYTPYLNLLKLKKDKISSEDIISEFKKIFSSSIYSEDTWDFYAKTLMLWIRYLDLGINEKLEVQSKSIPKPAKKLSKEKLEILTLNYSPYLLMEAFIQIIEGDISDIGYRKQRDLILLDLISVENELITLTRLGEKAKNSEDALLHILVENSLLISKVKIAFEAINAKPNIKSSELLKKYPQLTEVNTSITSKKQVISILYSWANFIYSVKVKKEPIRELKKGRNSKSELPLSCGPETLYKTFKEFTNNSLVYNTHSKRKLNELALFGITEKEKSVHQLTSLGRELKNAIAKDEGNKFFASIVSKNELISKVLNYVEGREITRTKHLLTDIPDLVEGLNKASKKTRYSVYLSWAKYIKNHLNGLPAPNKVQNSQPS